MWVVVVQCWWLCGFRVFGVLGFKILFWDLRVVGYRWVMRCWFGYGWCSVDAGGLVLDFNFWVCVLRFGFVFLFNTYLDLNSCNF